MNTVNRLCVVFLFLLIGCAAPSIERDFFRTPSANSKERLTQYSLEDQYKIFRYGNDRIEPPHLELAEPIAERGKAVVPFLLKKLESENDDLSVRDIVYLFSVMSALHAYDVGSDGLLMRELSDRVNSMKKWQETAQAMLVGIKKRAEKAGTPRN